MRRQSFELNVAAASMNERPASCNPRSKSAKTVMKKMYCLDNDDDGEAHVIANNYLEFKRMKNNRYRKTNKVMWRDVRSSGGTRNDLTGREVLQIPKFTFPRWKILVLIFQLNVYYYYNVIIYLMIFKSGIMVFMNDSYFLF